MTAKENIDHHCVYAISKPNASLAKGPDRSEDKSRPGNFNVRKRLLRWH